MIKCCIFDLDGTLLNTLPTIKYYINKTLSAYGFYPLSDDECRAFVGSGAKVLMRRALESRSASGTAEEEIMLKEYMAAYDNDPYYLTEKYEGIERLIKNLKERGIKLAVLSNKPNFATRAAVAHFFGDSFDAVYGGRDNIPLKPDPSGCFEILSELSVSPSECAYVGDSDVDVLTGKSMGAALNISVLWGFRGREELLSSGADILCSDADKVGEAIIR